jgi:hypothetical protein
MQHVIVKPRLLGGPGPQGLLRNGGKELMQHVVGEKNQNDYKQHKFTHLLRPINE